MSEETKPIYRVLFQQGSELYEVYVASIFQSDIYGFVEVEDFIFDERSKTLVDPVTEKLKAEFLNVGRTFIPLHSVVRIDEVEKAAAPKVVSLASAPKSTPGAGSFSMPNIPPKIPSPHNE